MSGSIKDTLTEFISKQVSLGNATSVQNAEKQIKETLEEMETNRLIKIGETQISNGQYHELNEEFVEKLKFDITQDINNKSLNA